MWIARTCNIKVYEGEPWGFDNGAFRDFKAGRPFDERLFHKALGRALSAAHPPILAVTPDIVEGGPASLAFSLYWRAQLPDELPWYLAVQDGLEPADVEPHVEMFNGVFLGGSNAYKATARQWRDFTRLHGMGFHYGRAGTPRKLVHAIDCEADSIDSAFLMWKQRRWERFADIAQRGHEQLWLLSHS
jgi:hypothetical protein